MPIHTQIGTIWIDVAVRQSHGVSAEVTDHPVETGSNISDHIRPRPRRISIEGIVTNHPIEVPGSNTDGAREDPSPLAIDVEGARVSKRAITIEGEPSIGALAGLIPGVDQGVALLGAVGIEVRSKRQFSAIALDVAPRGNRTQLSAQALHFTSEFDRPSAVHAAMQEAVEAGKLLTVVTALQTYENVALTDYDGTIEGPGRKLTFSAEGVVLRLVSSQTVKLPNPVVQRAKPKLSAGKQNTTPATPAEQEAAADTIGLGAQLLGLG